MSIRDLIVTVVSVEFGLHYFPWRMLPMLRGKELPRLAAYVLGLLGMMIPFTLYLIDHGQSGVVEVLWMVILSAGMAVFAMYGLDRYMDLDMRDVESTEHEILHRNPNAKKS